MTTAEVHASVEVGSVGSKLLYTLLSFLLKNTKLAPVRPVVLFFNATKKSNLIFSGATGVVVAAVIPGYLELIVLYGIS